MSIPNVTPSADKSIEHANEATTASETKPSQDASELSPQLSSEPHPCWIRLQSSKCLLAVLCVCAFAQSMVINGLVPISITTIEKRFHLTSNQSGLFSSMYDIGVLITLLPVCYFGEKGHKGRWIAAGMFFLGLGSLVCTIPHFTGEQYLHGKGRSSEICIPDSVGLMTQSQPNGRKESYAYPFLLIGQFLHGVGAAPLYTLGVSYLDESVSQKMSPVYLGLFLSSATLGPAIGFLLGGLLLGIDGNIDKPNKSISDVLPGDPYWYGAWWIGFLITSAILFSVSPLLCAFRRVLPEAKLHAKERIDQTNQMIFANALTANTSRLKDFPHLLMQMLLSNCAFLFIVIKDVLSSFLINGFITFLPKFTETVFLLSSSISSIVTGGAFVPPAVMGNVLGGYLIKWFKLRCRQTIALCIICEIVCLLLVPTFLLDSQGAPLAGADIHYNSSSSHGQNLVQQCNSDCSCDFVYSPVCDESTGVTYFSPCYAGCRKIEERNTVSFNESHTGWEDCRCLIDSPNVPAKESAPLSNIVARGSCRTGGFAIYVFFALFIFLIFFTFLAAMPSQQAILRCVPFEQRTLALGVDYVFARALGSVPGPIAFGSLIDTTCNVWAGKGDDGLSCMWYDSEWFKTIIFILSAIFKLLSILALLVAWKMYRPPNNVENSARIRWNRIKCFVPWRCTGRIYTFNKGDAVLRSYGKTLS